jgi:cobalt-zinc-cadmium efflux system outer membrane protein
MRIATSVVAACATLFASSTTALAQGQVLTLAEVLARARERAPQIVSAQLTLEELRGRLAGASLRVQSNPEVDAGLGNREGPERRFTEFELGLSQSFEPGSRRTERMAGANASIAHATADIEEVTRIAQRASAVAFHRVLHADERIRLLTASEGLAENVYSIADRRFKAGDIAVLDVNIARASLARLRAEREAAEAGKAVALGELKQLLQVEGEIAAAGDLTNPAAVALDGLLASAAQRPEIRSLESAIQEAEAESRLGDAFSKPDYGLGVRYSREEGDHIVLGGLTLSLPFFAKGQELRAVGAARAARFRAELDATRTRIRLEVQSALDAYSHRRNAVRLLETDAIAGLDENETLTARSFEVGQLGLLDLLLIRRAILDTRSQYLDALLDAAVARIELDAAAGVLR